jgi:sec-independent protein translocase protein TatA
MGSFSIWHWLVVLVVVLLLFGSGKISGLMGDVAKGIKSFKANIKEDEKPADASMAAESAPPAGTIAGPQGATTTAGNAAAQPAAGSATGRPAA